MTRLSWRTQLEDRTAADASILRAALITAKKSRAVKCSLLVKHEVAVGIRSVRAALEAVQHLLRPRAAFRLRRTQFEDGSAIRIDSLIARSGAATEIGRAIKIASAVEHQVAHGNVAIAPTPKTVNHGFRPSSPRYSWGHHFVDCPTADIPSKEQTSTGPSISRSSVEIVRCVSYQASSGSSAVAGRISLKHMQDGFAPRAVLLRQLEHRATLSV